MSEDHAFVPVCGCGTTNPGSAEEDGPRAVRTRPGARLALCLAGLLLVAIALTAPQWGRLVRGLSRPPGLSPAAFAGGDRVAQLRPRRPGGGSGQTFEEMAAEAARLAQAAPRLATQPGCAARAAQIRAYAAEIGQLAAQGSQERQGPQFRALRLQIEGRLAELRQLASAAVSGELAYRVRLREVARSAVFGRRTRVTMSWPADPQNAEAALPWAKRLGANEIVATKQKDPQAVAIWKRAGYNTVLLTMMPTWLPEYVRSHPDQAQVGWAVTKPSQAVGTSLAIPVGLPANSDKTIDPGHDPKRSWRVLDWTSGEMVPPDRWEVSAARDQVTVQGCSPGHEYLVYFLTAAPVFGDPFLPDFRKASLQALDDLLTPFNGSLDVLWVDGIAYAQYGLTPAHVWDLDAYLYMARPETLARFEGETGVRFDPRWLVNLPRALDAPVSPEYLKWVAWVQPQVDTWIKEATSVAQKHNVQTWVYWGDAHVGMEPYLAPLTDVGIGEVDRPTRNEVGGRVLADLPGNPLRRCRVLWLSAKKKPVDPAWGVQMRDRWAAVRRGMLMRPLTGLYWVRFEDVANAPDETAREDLVDTMAEINDEFRLLADNVGDQPAWTDDLDVYVVNVWGKRYSWQPDGDLRLAPFTDLPVRMHFLSLADIEASGIPADAKVLVAYGMPNTAQSGGAWWQSRRIADAVHAFVRAGGGFVGLQAPSASGSGGEAWPLTDLLGIAPGSAVYLSAGERVRPEPGDEMGEEGRGQGLGGAAALEVASGNAKHWLARRGAIAGLGVDVQVKAASPTEVVYVARNAGAACPGVIAHEEGRGRCVWLAGYASAPAFSGLIRDAVFWAAKRESAGDRVEVTQGDGVYLYAYPGAAMAALHNSSDQPVNADCRLDPSVLKAGPAAKLRDIVTGDRVDLAGGTFRLPVPPRCTRLLRVEP